MTRKRRKEARHEARPARWLLPRHHVRSDGRNPEGRSPRLRLRVDSGGLGLRRRLARCLDPRADGEDQGRHCHHANARADTGNDGNDGDDPLCPVGGALHPGPRTLRAAGRRGLARRRIRSAPHAHQGVHLDHSQDPRAQGEGDARGLPLSAPLPGPGCHGPGQAAEEHPARRSGTADLHRLDLAEGDGVREPRWPTASSRFG